MERRGIFTFCSRSPAAGRRIFVVSDMLELGESAPQLHYQVGEQAAQSGVDLLLAWGELSQELVRGAGEGQHHRHDDPNSVHIHIRSRGVPAVSSYLALLKRLVPPSRPGSFTA